MRFPTRRYMNRGCRQDACMRTSRRAVDELSTSCSGAEGNEHWASSHGYQLPDAGVSSVSMCHFPILVPHSLSSFVFSSSSPLLMFASLPSSTRSSSICAVGEPLVGMLPVVCIRCTTLYVCMSRTMRPVGHVQEARCATSVDSVTLVKLGSLQRRLAGSLAAYKGSWAYRPPRLLVLPLSA